MSQRNEIRLIKKYPNRRLYDTHTSTYITLSEIKQMVLGSEVFEIVDVKSNENLTRSVLLQIVLEEESVLPLFSSVVLSQIIRSYGHVMQGVLSSYLEKNICVFADIQDSLTAQAQTIDSSLLNNDMWQQFLSMQASMVQKMMSGYIHQSKNMFIQIQEQMKCQASQDLDLFEENIK